MNKHTIVCLSFLVAMLISSICTSQAFSSNYNGRSVERINTSKRWSSSSRSRGLLSMYLPSSTPTTQTPAMVAQSILSSQNSSPPSTPKVKKLDTKRGQGALGPLSNSVLASCDTLPHFPTAHGLLSPETVARLSQLPNHHNEAVQNFLDTYRSKGPMSCLSMLADPDVLPYLTEAMRDIA